MIKVRVWGVPKYRILALWLIDLLIGLDATVVNFEIWVIIHFVFLNIIFSISSTGKCVGAVIFR
ncbi:hypothetical protein PIPA1_31160 [Pelosinus sp. IPA-1]|nr:hypothetical protein PIPA1_31160 [Pelosinus sp. IPA-1]